MNTNLPTTGATELQLTIRNPFSNGFMKNIYLTISLIAFIVIGNAQITTANASIIHLGNKSILDTKWQKGGVYEKFTPEQEVLEKRTKVAKHFLKSDGSYSAFIGDTKHYLDENGAWQDIDFTIKENKSKEFSDLPFCNVTNDIQTYYPSNAGSLGIMMQYEGRQFSFWENPKMKILNADNKTIETFNALKSKGIPAAEAIRYNSYPGVTDEFVTINGGVENNIIVNSLQGFLNVPNSTNNIAFEQFIPLTGGYKVFNNNQQIDVDFITESFMVKLPGDSLGFVFEPIVTFDNGITKERAFALLSMSDEKMSASEITERDAHVIKGKHYIHFVPGGIIVSTVMPISWLQNSSRMFPVTIDPTVSIGTGTSTQAMPWDIYYGYGRSAAIYTAAEVGATNINITGAFWYVGTAYSSVVPYVLRFNSTAATTLAAGTWANTISGSTQVKSGSVAYSSSGGWYGINAFSTAYNYPSNNLLVLCESNYGGGGTGSYPLFRYSTTSSNMHEYWRQDNSAPTGSGTITTSRPNIYLEYTVPCVAPTGITGASLICTGSGGSNTLTSSGGSLGTDAVDVWYAGACGTDAYINPWTVNSFTAGSNQTTFNSVTGGLLNVTSAASGGDAFIHMPGLGSFAPATYKYINVRFRVTSVAQVTGMQIFWYNSLYTGASANQYKDQAITSVQNVWQTVSIDMSSPTVGNWLNSNVTGWRFDWTTNNSVTMDIDFITLSTQPMIGSGSSITVSPTVTTTYYTSKEGACGQTACASQVVTVGTCSPPTISGFTPTDACAGSGATITISGTNFLGATGVTINGVAASFSVTNATTISATLPAGASSTGNIVVTTPINPPASKGAFTVKPLPVITGNPVALKICENGGGTFTAATSTGSPTYLWEYGDNVTWNSTIGLTGLSGQTSNTLTLTNTPIGYTGVYVHCVVTAGGCSAATSSALLTVDNLPTTPTIVANSTPTCEGDPVILTASSGLLGGPTNVASNLVAYYPFYNNLNDASGNGLNLSGTGNFNNGGVNLTGSTLTSASTSILNTDNHTIAFYMKYTTPSDATWANMIFSYAPTGTDRSPTIWKYSGANYHHWQYATNGTNTPFTGAGDGAVTYTVGQWYYVVGVKNGSTFTLYTDGVQVATGVVANPKFAGNSILQFGSAAGVVLREFKVFNKSLSNTEVSQLGQWKWYSGSCGGTAIGSGPSVTVNPTTYPSTTYYLRGESACGNSACGTIDISLPWKANAGPDQLSNCSDNVSLAGSVSGTIPSSNSTIFTETFDNTWYALNIPTASWSTDASSTSYDWHRNDITTNWTFPTGGSPSGSGAASTSYYARFHSYAINSTTINTSLITPNIDLSASTSNSLTFYYINPTQISDKLEVYFSNTGGSSWGSPVATYQTDASWSQKTIAIPLAYQVSNFKVRFKATADYGNDDIGIDQVVVTGNTASTPTYSWTGPSGVTFTPNNTTQSPTADKPGTYTLSVTAGGCTSTDQVVITKENTKPILAGCPSDIAVNTNVGKCTGTASWTTPTWTDACKSAGVIVPGATYLGTTGGNYYYFVAGNIRWTNAKAAAQAKGGKLAIIESATENSALSTMLQNNGYTNNEAFWIGYTDDAAHGGSEGNFVSVTGVPLSYGNNSPLGYGVYNNWNPGEPNNAGGENFTSINSSAGQWNDLPDTFCCISGYIMEYGVFQTSGVANGSTNFPLGVTTNTYNAYDFAGNVSNTCSFKVTVTDNIAPTITCPAAPAAVNAIAGTCAASVATSNPTTADNCSVTKLTWTLTGATTGSSAATGINNVGTRSFNVGTTNVAYTVTDAAGLTATCNFNVVVTDNIAPTIICPSAPTAVNAIAGTCAASVATSNPTTADNCSVTKLTWTLTGATTGSSAATGINNVGTQSFNVGTTTVTYIVSDAAGQTATCNFNVVVNDNQAPILSACPADIAVCSSNAVVTYTTPTATDNCSGVTVVQIAGLASGSTFPVGITTNTFRAEDANGNKSAPCSFTVTVTSATANVILANSTVLAAVEQCEESGWTYYADPSDFSKWLFGIYKNGNTFSPTVEINVKTASPTEYDLKEDPSNFKAVFTMGRYWNVTSGNITGTNPMKVRFFYNPSDVAAMQSQANAWATAHPCTIPGYTTTVGGLEWFKTVNTSYMPSRMNATGNHLLSDSLLKFAANTSTLNSINYMQYDNVLSFSGGTSGIQVFPIPTGTTPIPLPIKLISFTAKAIENQYIHLDWATAIEIDNKGFEIERSVDGVSFEGIGWVAGNNNSTSQIVYSFDDKTALQDIRYFYRLKQIDFDGDFEYSSLASAILVSNLKTAIGDFVPNPTGDKSYIEFFATKAQTATITVFDAMGKLIRNEAVAINKGFNTYNINAVDLASSVYMVNFRFDDQRFTKRLNVVK